MAAWSGSFASSALVNKGIPIFLVCFLVLMTLQGVPTGAGEQNEAYADFHSGVRRGGIS